MGKTEIKVSCNDQVLKITDAPVLASGGLNEVHVAFNFCEKWAGFIKTAIFYRNEEEAYYAVLDETDTCIVPWEVCYEEGTFYFGVFGEKDGIRRTSNVVRYKVKKGAITPDMKPSEPTPEVYDQIISIVSENKAVTEEFISDMEEKVESGYFNGEDGEDAYTPVRGVDYWTLEDQTEILDKCCTSFTESGAIVACDPVEGYPLNVVTHIEPVQAGSGIPSPDNVRPITGWTGAKLWRGSKNLFNESAARVGSNWYIDTTSSYYVFEIGGLKPNTAYTFSFTENSFSTNPNPNLYLVVTNDPSSLGTSQGWFIHPAGGYLCNQSATIVSNGDGKLFIRTYGMAQDEAILNDVFNTAKNGMLEHGEYQTEYEPYRGEFFHVDFGQAVYGGSYDWKTGVLTVDAVYARITSDKLAMASGDTYCYTTTDALGTPIPNGNGDASYRRYCNCFEPYYTVANGDAEFNWKVAIFDNGIIRFGLDYSWNFDQIKEWFDEHEVVICYPVEPATVQLTPQQILALSGRNTLYSDTGDTAVTGRTDPTAVIEKLTNAIIALGGNV